MDIMETIRARYSEISSVQKRIADYCLEHPDEASFQTLREFAQTTHTTDATVLKFCSNMGCQGFLAFRRQLQEYVRMRLSPNDKIRMSLTRSIDAHDTCRKIVDGEKRGLDMTFQYLDMDSFRQIVYRLNHARRIFVAGHHLTRIVADFFLYQLKRIGREAYLVDTSDKKQTRDMLLHVTSEDVFVLISIPIYAELTIQLAQYLREAKITSISITDSLTSPVAQACELSLTCNTEHDVFFNSVTPMIALIETLAAGLLLGNRGGFTAAQERLEQIEEKLGIQQSDHLFIRSDIPRET